MTASEEMSQREQQTPQQEDDDDDAQHNEEPSKLFAKEEAKIEERQSQSPASMRNEQQFLGSRT